MAIWSVPNYNNTALHTQNNGVRHMPTQFLSGGRSLDPMQRNGMAPVHGLAVQPVASSRSIQGNLVAPPTNIPNPAMVAFAGNVSHTRMWNNHV